MRLGKYRHYKGNDYEVICLARDSETLEEVVVYRALYDSPEFGPGVYWVRRQSNFQENVDYNNEIIPRFQYIGDQQ